MEVISVDPDGDLLGGITLEYGKDMMMFCSLFVEVNSLMRNMERHDPECMHYLAEAVFSVFGKLAEKMELDTKGIDDCCDKIAHAFAVAAALRQKEDEVIQ